MEIGKVFCPYCGGEMKRTDVHIHSKPKGYGYLLQCHYYCPACRSGAPWADVDTSEEEEVIQTAYNLAKNRASAKQQ